ncbi:MAG: FGGY family carbohydrate kinase, partial [bacterium]|nr:FGGY family carbohydrate kinase [bacterium]
MGTTSFKCALVRNGVLVSEPVVASYSLKYDGVNVTVDPDVYLETARSALQKVCRQAGETGLEVEAIGITSQAQTYVVLDKEGLPLQPAVVWLDGRAETEARKVAAVPDFILHSGMQAPTGTLFLPKVMHFMRHTDMPHKRELKFLLLNEYIIHYLTGTAYGDNVNQGMGGF